jgi:hypothetical protein
MKLLRLFGFLLILMLAACSKNDYSPYSYANEETIYSTNDNTVLRELLVILKPYIEIDNQKKFLITDTLFNVTIRINDNLWGTFNSMQVDTSIFDKEIINNQQYSTDAAKYSIIAQYQDSKDTLTTAGEYADLLNNYFTLEPGFYICEVESFEMKSTNGNIVKVKTNIIEAIEVKNDSRSTFIGEFEVLIK